MEDTNTTQPKKKTKNLGGRPTIYTQELADKICEKIAQGSSMRKACKDDDMPTISTVFCWFRTKEGFSAQYAKATEERTEAMAEDILDISDDASLDVLTEKKIKGPDGKFINVQIENKEFTNRSRLRVDTRKWIMSKMKPKKYGDKVDVTSGDAPLKGNTIVFSNFKENE